MSVVLKPPPSRVEPQAGAPRPPQAGSISSQQPLGSSSCPVGQAGPGEFQLRLLPLINAPAGARDACNKATHQTGQPCPQVLLLGAEDESKNVSSLLPGQVRCHGRAWHREGHTKVSPWGVAGERLMQGSEQHPGCRQESKVGARKEECKDRFGGLSPRACRHGGLEGWPE